jgi:trehalose 6-phosphate synthase
MGARLIVVSNRVAVPGDAPAAGGLAVAVEAALSKHPGMWFGWSGRTIEEGGSEEAKYLSQGHTDYGLIDLPATDFQEYYNGFANRVLWPILHYRLDLAEFSRADLSGYFRVNNRFALHLSQILNPHDVVWVHDYHLIPLGFLLRAQGHHHRTGFFLHIPCPPPDVLTALPRHKDVMGTLLSYDVVGVQTDTDRRNLCDYLLQLGAEEISNSVLSFANQTTTIITCPVGIEAEAVKAAATCQTAYDVSRRVADSLLGAHLLIGVDRLDYSKGLDNRLAAISTFFDRYPHWETKATLLQIAPKSRVDIPEYLAMGKSVSAAAGTINGNLGDLTWAPIRYVNKNYSRDELAGLYRLARVALVTPLRDGMNLVAKEFVAAHFAYTVAWRKIRCIAKRECFVYGDLMRNLCNEKAMNAYISFAVIRAGAVTKLKL